MTAAPTPMANSAPVDRRHIADDLDQYATALTGLDAVERDLVPLTKNDMHDLVVDAGAVLHHVGRVIAEIDALRRSSWATFGPIDRFEALDEAMRVLDGALVALPDNHRWPEALAMAIFMEDDDL